MTDKVRPGALRLAAMEGQKRNGSPVRDIQEQLDAALVGVQDVSEGNLSLPGRVSETGLELPPGLTFDQWQQVGLTLKRIKGAWEWWVGDWLNYGERTYGEMYSQAMDETGLDYHRLAQIRHVAEKIEPAMRRPSLSFGHHEAVVPLVRDQRSKAVELLDTAEAEGWKRAEIRQAAKQLNKLPPAVKIELACQCHCHTHVACECGLPL